jgi:High-affinity nickel-transport protein
MLVGTLPSRAVGLGMLATSFVFGLRHGIDWDHLAAISDLTSSQLSSRRSMLTATWYAIGHAAVVFVLGAAAVLFAARLPASIDSVMERIVGATLLVLGVVVLVSLVRNGRDFRMRSRWMVVIATCRRAVGAMRSRRATTPEYVVIEHDHPHRHDAGHRHGYAHSRPAAIVGGPSDLHSSTGPAGASEDGRTDAGEVRHRHAHRHVLPVPGDPFGGPGVAGALGIGALHGVGAETPTQVVVFVGAAGASGPVAGLLVLACFVLGLLVSNTLVAAASTFGRLGSARRFPVYAGLSVVTALFSLIMGTLFVAGRAGALPTLFGG